jgi:RNA exonuclease 4
MNSSASLNRQSEKCTNARSRRREQRRLRREGILIEKSKNKYVAIDCEMVGVGLFGQRSALARVSIVGGDGNVILDKYVKVSEPVTDYRTFVSGILPEHIESEEALSFHECQKIVHSILRDKIVVGHALCNDFEALKISHPWYMIRDTATYEPYMKPNLTKPGYLSPRRLRDLSNDVLGLSIQQAGKEHCSVEDARAAMALYRIVQQNWEKVVSYNLYNTRQMEEYHQRMVERNIRLCSPMAHFNAEPIGCDFAF